MNTQSRLVVAVSAAVLAVSMFVLSSPSRDIRVGFTCSNSGRVVISKTPQPARLIASKYCTGDIDAAERALIKRYRSEFVPPWAFVNVETLGR